MVKLKNSIVIKLKKLKLWWNLKTQIVIKFKNSNDDKTQKLKLWQNSKTEAVTKLKKIKMWQNTTCDKTQVVTKPKFWQNSNCDKTQVVTKPKGDGHQRFSWDSDFEIRSLTSSYFQNVRSLGKWPRFLLYLNIYFLFKCFQKSEFHLSKDILIFLVVGKYQIRAPKANLSIHLD